MHAAPSRNDCLHWYPHIYAVHPKSLTVAIKVKSKILVPLHVVGQIGAIQAYIYE